MSATIRLVLLLLLGCLGTRQAGEARHHPEPHQDNSIAGKSATIDHEHRLLLECQHSDYRTYIKCLKREKRHHYDDHGNRRNCLDECLDGNCTSPACTRDCYAHCRQRVIEVSSKTIETTYDCSSGDCQNSKQNSNVPNITTNIHILPQNITLHCEKSKNGSGSGSGEDNEDDQSQSGNSTKIDINNVINNNFIQQPTPALCPCPGCYCYDWQPQITIGIGLGGGPMGGGCFSSWPCIQKSSVDCSMCNNAFMRYQCSPTCIPIPSQNSTVAASRRSVAGNSAERQYNGNGYNRINN